MLLKEVGKLFRMWEILCKPQKSVLVHGPLIRNQMSFDFVLFCGTLGHLGWLGIYFHNSFWSNHVDKICLLHTSHTNKEGLYYILSYFVSFIYLIYCIQLWASKQYSISLITFLGVIKKRNSLILFSSSKEGRDHLCSYQICSFCLISVLCHYFTYLSA